MASLFISSLAPPATVVILLEAENSGVHIPAEIRWLGGAKVRARLQTCKDGSSSVVSVVLGEATYGRLRKSGVRLLGRRYEVGAFEEALRPESFCGRCSGWGHITPHCLATIPPGAPFVRRTTSRPTTAAPSRDAKWGEAASAHAGQPRAPTAEGPTGRGRMPEPTREGPASPPGCGSHQFPLHAGRGGRRGLWSLPRLSLPR